MTEKEIKMNYLQKINSNYFVKIHTFIFNISIFISIFLFIGIHFSLIAQTVSTTVHNLSVSGTGTIKASSETEICIFCHTPHNSKPFSPLWNRSDPGTTYALYNSSTAQAAPGQPDGSSILCLSCHDGTIALGNVLSLPAPIGFASGIVNLPPGTTNLGTDLANDHPISMIYDASLASQDGQLVNPVALTGVVKLENQKMQCTACHDAHSNEFSNFLVTSNAYSALCNFCHTKTFWNQSTHKTSTATWSGSGTNPWQHTSFSGPNVAKNGCENCHNPHNAGGKPRLLNYDLEETNCLVCHSGTVAASAKNIQTQLNKTYKHNVAGYTNIHDPQEAAIATTMHVECEDCHNPHSVNGSITATAPSVNGYTYGTRGVNQNGLEVNPANFEYEICYRCHSDSPNKPPSLTSRVISQNNVRLEFAQGNPSYHPVAYAGVNSTITGLLNGQTASSRIYCTDCHASNGTGSPAGPHGSIYPSILKYQYLKANNTPESAANYDLCYKCHNRTLVIQETPNAFPFHRKHIVEEQTPCNVCHDPHGISSSQGNSTNNTALINFDISIVGLNSSNLRKFVDLGNHHGNCYLTCHGENHNSTSYQY